MKILKTLSLLVPFMLISTTHAQLGRKIEAAYYGSQLPEFEITWLHYGKTQNNGVQTCDSTAIVDTKLSLGFTTLKTRNFLNAEEPFYSGQFDRKCNWDDNEIRKGTFAKNQYLVKDTKLSFTLDSMAPGLNAILGRFHIEGPIVPEFISASGRSRVSYGADINLSRCQLATGAMMDPKDFGNASVAQTDLRDVLSGLRNMGFDQILKCELSAKSTGILGDVEKAEKKESWSFKERFTISTLANDDRLFIDFNNFSERNPIRAFIPAVKRDLNAENAAIHAVRDLIEFITEDYGDLLYNLNSSKKTEAEKNEITRGYFERNGAKIAEYLRIIDSNYDHVSLMNKISILMSFERMYSTIRTIENRISVSNYTLDRFVKRSVK